VPSLHELGSVSSGELAFVPGGLLPYEGFTTVQVGLSLARLPPLLAFPHLFLGPRIQNFFEAGL
jgi:hypothetical protein